MELELTNAYGANFSNEKRRRVVGVVMLLVLLFLFPSSMYAQGLGDAKNESVEDQTFDEVEEAGETDVPRPELQNRLIGFGLIGGSILALLGLLFAYLRMDHATRGFYGGRLQLVAIIAAIAILAICYFLWTQIFFR